MRWLLLVLVGCGRAPYEDYWADEAAFPTIDSIEPAVLESRNGGDQIRILGERLADTRTVVIGGRNAKILATGKDFVTVETPFLGAGPAAVEVALATTDGLVRLEEGLTYVPVSALTAYERVSVALWRVDCPAEVWAVDPSETLVPVDYCGPAQGRAGAIGFVTPSIQSGYAGDLAGIVPISRLPLKGKFRVIGPGEPAGFAPPLLFAPVPAGDLISITTPRNFGRDVQAVADQIDRLVAYHSQDWETAEPVVRLFDDEVCWIDELPVSSANGPALTVDGDATGAVGMWLGATAGGLEGFVATSRLSAANGGSLLGLTSGVDLKYSLFEGAYLPLTAAGYLGAADFPTDVTYQVRTTHLGDEVGRGAVAGVQALEISEPDVFSGAVVVNKAEDLVIRWTPGTDSEAILGIEIRVWDADVDAPLGETQEITRLSARADDGLGELVIPANQLYWLPSAPNRVDAEGEKIGLWATLTVARHGLRAVQIDDGDLVMDFIHAAELPVVLE
jgi:hypothetical protein